jgi:hypothetical protein
MSNYTTGISIELKLDLMIRPGVRDENCFTLRRCPCRYFADYFV